LLWCSFAEDRSAPQPAACPAAPALTVSALPCRAATTLCAKYNDLDSVREIFKQNKGEIAGVILEPVVGNSGFIAPTQEFLEVRL